MKAQNEGPSTPSNVDSLRKLATKNFARFAIQVQHASEEVQKKIIEQLPEFKELATGAIEKISQAHERTLSSLQKSEDEVHLGLKEWRAALIAMLDNPDLSLDDKLRITAEIGETVKHQVALLRESNRAKAALFGTVVLGVVGAVGVVVVAIAGGKFGIDQGGNDA